MSGKLVPFAIPKGKSISLSQLHESMSSKAKQTKLVTELAQNVRGWKKK